MPGNSERMNVWIQIIFRKVIGKIYRIRWNELKLNKTTPFYLLFKTIELIFKIRGLIFIIIGLIFKISRLIFKISGLIFNIRGLTFKIRVLK